MTVVAPAVSAYSVTVLKRVVYRQCGFQEK